MGSVLGTAAEVVDGLRDEGIAAGVLGITCYRPWPHDELRDALRTDPTRDRGQPGHRGRRRKHPGSGRAAHRATRHRGPRRRRWGSAAGRSRAPDCAQLVLDVLHGRLEPGALHFVDLDETVATAELAREEEVTVP